MRIFRIRSYFCLLTLLTVTFVISVMIVENFLIKPTPQMWQHGAIRNVTKLKHCTQELSKYDHNNRSIKSQGPNPHEWQYEVIRKDNKWKGCTQKFCEYDHNCRSIKSRGNQSCCQEHSVKILSEVKDLLQYYKLNYWIHYGTLLGAVREQDFIAWETDIDLQIDDTAKEFLFPGSKREDVALIFSKPNLPYAIKFFSTGVGRGCIIYKDQEQFPLGTFK